MANWIDMSIEPKDNEVPVTAPMYPYGLCICLTGDQLDQLDLENPEVGDMLELNAMVKVTSFSEHETMGKRAELQIIAIKEPEDDGDDDDYSPKGKMHEKMYDNEG